MSPFTQAKLRRKEELEKIDENPEKLQESKGHKHINDIFEKFAYTPVMELSKSRTSMVKTPKPATQRKSSIPSIQKDVLNMPKSNLFFRNMTYSGGLSPSHTQDLHEFS